MKPIPTIHEGVKFRSRLEARWALFFDRLQIHWSYEPFELNNNNLSYKPDFLLNNLFLPLFNECALVEIKPLEPNKEYIEYLKEAKGNDSMDIFIFFGEPNFSVKNAIRIFSSGPINKKQVLSERGKIVLCKKCKWYEWLDEQGCRRAKSCECKLILWRPGDDIEVAHLYASQYRFDLNQDEI